MSIITHIKAYVDDKYERGLGEFLEEYESFTYASREGENYTMGDYVVTHEELPPGEGGATEQRFILKFQKDGEEPAWVEFPVEWVSWDGMYYEDTENTMQEVEPVAVTVTVFKAKAASA